MGQKIFTGFRVDFIGRELAEIERCTRMVAEDLCSSYIKVG
jgi:hypothetical protein